MPSIALADPRQAHRLREWLQNVYPLYLHDISEFDASRYRLTTSGHWTPDYLPYWLEHSFCLPLVALASDDPIGFAFVGRPPFPFMSASCDFRLCEFFVLRAYRRTGLGRMIALEVFSKMPGMWELVVLARNAQAAQFWREVLPLACAARPRESSDANGFHFLFSSRASEPTVEDRQATDFTTTVRRPYMSIQLDHTIVPARNKIASAKLLAELLGVPWAEAGVGPFSPVYVNDGLTLDFIETDEDFPVYHFCFRVRQEEFDAILQRIKAAGIQYRSTVHGPMDMQINTQFGNIYWNEPEGHQWEMLTVSYARPS